MKTDSRHANRTHAKTKSSQVRPTREETLDPDDWDEIRRLGHRMLDDMMDYLSSVRERPAWQAVPAEVKQSLSGPVPHEPCDLESVYADFRRQILPYPTGNIHPRFWGWVMGTGTPVAMLAEMLAAGMNSWVGGFDQSATLVEEQVLSWLTDMLGFPQGTSGVLTSGCPPRQSAL
jgi:aromatic-L-amino-acid/L-tryptophan decarboxylase